ncbi:hypothetical protein OAG26_01890, partial [Flavobacteriales bacterium]|nr:hypothetical protein [Flavobacteriales bacterium]
VRIEEYEPIRRGFVSANVAARIGPFRLSLSSETLNAVILGLVGLCQLPTAIGTPIINDNPLPIFSGLFKDASCSKLQRLQSVKTGCDDGNLDFHSVELNSD